MQQRKDFWRRNNLESAQTHLLADDDDHDFEVSR